MEAKEGADHVPVTVHAVLPDPNTDTQIVLLKDAGQDQILPIWVGTAEGNAIRLAMESVVTPRPMSHDLIRSFAEHLNIKVSKIVVTEVKNNTYYASIHLVSRESERTVDARPSDAIAVALRMNSPIYVTADVLRQRSGGKLDAWLEKLDLKQFGKYEV